MNTRQKGRRYVRALIDIFRRLDPETYEIPGSGAGTDKGDIRLPRYNLVIEAKNQNRLSIKDDILQAQRQGLHTSNYALIFRHPESPEANPESFVVVDLPYFEQLLQRNAQMFNDTREVRWTTQSLIKEARRLLKLLEQ